jgi:hypothetical protein
MPALNLAAAGLLPTPSRRSGPFGPPMSHLDYSHISGAVEAYPQESEFLRGLLILPIITAAWRV